MCVSDQFYTIQTSVNAKFYVRNFNDSLLADEGSAGLGSHDKEIVKTGRSSCVPCYSYSSGEGI